MLGVIIGVASVLTTLGIGRGASADIMQDIASEGLTLLNRRIRHLFRLQTWTSGQPLTMADVAALSDPSLHPDIGQAVPLYRQYINLGSRQQQHDSAEVLGATSAYAEMHGLELAQGRFLTADEIAQRTKSVVIGADARQEGCLRASTQSGQSLRIERTNPIPSSACSRKRGWGRIGNVDGSAIIPLAVAQERLRPPYHRPPPSR